MLLSLFFDSKSKKLVKRWRKEHEKLIANGNKVLAKYMKKKDSETRKALKKFMELVIEHLSDEDKEL